MRARRDEAEAAAAAVGRSTIFPTLCRTDEGDDGEDESRRRLIAVPRPE